jgi:hypothetical protein
MRSWCQAGSFKLISSKNEGNSQSTVFAVTAYDAGGAVNKEKRLNIRSIRAGPMPGDASAVAVNTSAHAVALAAPPLLANSIVHAMAPSAPLPLANNSNFGSHRSYNYCSCNGFFGPPSIGQRNSNFGSHHIHNSWQWGLKTPIGDTLTSGYDVRRKLSR